MSERCNASIGRARRVVKKRVRWVMNDRNDGSKIGGGLYSLRIWEVNVQITKKEKTIKKKEKGGEREIRRRSSNGKRKAESKLEYRFTDPRKGKTHTRTQSYNKHIPQSSIVPLFVLSMTHPYRVHTCLFRFKGNHHPL